MLPNGRRFQLRLHEREWLFQTDEVCLVKALVPKALNDFGDCMRRGLSEIPDRREMWDVEAPRTLIRWRARDAECLTGRS